MAKSTQLSRTNFWLIATNSTAAYVLAYLIIFYIDFFVKIALAGNFGYDIGFDWDQILFYIEPYEWTHDSVKLIYSAGPILIVVTGVLSLIGFWATVEEPARIKILLVWLTMHSFNFFFGGLMIGNIFKEGVGHVFNWMYLTDTAKMIVALVGFMGLLGTAYFLSKPFAISSNAYFNKLGERNSPFFLTAQIIVPYILGTIIYMLYFLPRILFQESYSWISLGIMLLFIIMRISKMETQYYDEDERFVGASSILLVITIIVVIGMRIALNNEIVINW